jgi:ABC-type sugar transport system ATPase subunit
LSLARPLKTALSEPFGDAVAQPFLRVRGLSKSYGRVQALVDVTIDFLAGEVHAIVGENGAGKSTLTRLLGGEEQPDSGAIHIEGKAHTLVRPSQARRAGIAIVHQQFQLVEQLTVAANIALEDVPRLRAAGPLPVIDRTAMLRRAAERLAPFGLSDRAASRVRDLTIAEKQVVEIARALGGHPRLLILDEPTSALSAGETETLFAHIRALRKAGVAIIFIAHSLTEVLSIADRISVLRDGRLIATAPAGTLDAVALARLIVGRELAAAAEERRAQAGGDMALSVAHRQPEAGDAEPLIALRRGQIVGMPTYIGSAMRAFLARISGETPAGPLTVSLGGADVARASIAARIRRGLCLVPADATAEGLAPKLSIEDNILLPNAPRYTRFGLFRRSAARAAIDALIRDLDIRPTDRHVPVENLSGGNRQKVAIAKWLLSGADVLVMDDPTRGVDVGAKVEMYRIMRGHVEKGGAILIASSDLDELIGLSDRLVVIHGDRAIARFDSKPFDKAEVLAASSGGNHKAAGGSTS